MSAAIWMLVKITATLAAALIATGVARRARAASRHALLGAAFAVLLALPVAAVFAPTVRIEVPIAPAAGPAAIAESVSVLLAGSSRPPAAAASRSATRRATISPASTAAAVWLAGALMFLGGMLAGLRQARAIRARARRWPRAQAIANAMVADAGGRRPVDVRRHQSITGPMTCGVLRPAIVLPADAASWTDADLHRAILHELAHVRRGDWLTQAAARAIAACYWFHPLVWIAWRRFALEAERACDDAVVQRTEATAYADQLVALAERMVHARSASAPAMASPADLPSRVHALLDARQRRGPAGARCIAAMALVSTLLVGSMTVVQIVAAPRDGATPQTFETASVRPCGDDPSIEGQRRQEWRMPSPGRISIECATLERMIQYAYVGLGGGRSPLLNVHPLTEHLVRGGPAWIRSERFRVEAKADGAAGRAAMMGPMLRALLEDRFQLKTHRGTEEAPMYAMTVARNGLKIGPIGDDGCAPPEKTEDVPPRDRFAIDSGPKPTCGSFVSKGDGVNRTIYVGGETMQGFAGGALTLAVDRFVIDTTGISGRFNIRLTYGFDPGPNPSPSDIERGPSIFTALQEQLGLKLESIRGPREFLIIDHAQRPEAN
jgi:uncharacterized protein (TIGR03435 family)